MLVSDLDFGLIRLLSGSNSLVAPFLLLVNLAIVIALQLQNLTNFYTIKFKEYNI